MILPSPALTPTSRNCPSYNKSPNPSLVSLKTASFLFKVLLFLLRPGKTFVGIKLVQLLLQNSSPSLGGRRRNVLDNFSFGLDLDEAPKPDIGPLLIITFTNHALDQALEGLLDAGISEGVVRVGGRGKSEKLQRFNLFELMKEIRTPAAYVRRQHIE